MNFSMHKQCSTVIYPNAIYQQVCLHRNVYLLFTTNSSSHTFLFLTVFLLFYSKFGNSHAYGFAL